MSEAPNFADCQREPQVDCVCSKCHAYRVENKFVPQTVTVRLATEAVLLLCDIDPTKIRVEFKHAAAYKWPQRYIGKLFSEALRDCTPVMLASVIHVHTPYLPIVRL